MGGSESTIECTLELRKYFLSAGKKNVWNNTVNHFLSLLYFLKTKEKTSFLYQYNILWNDNFNKGSKQSSVQSNVVLTNKKINPVFTFLGSDTLLI